MTTNVAVAQIRAPARREGDAGAVNTDLGPLAAALCLRRARRVVGLQRPPVLGPRRGGAFPPRGRDQQRRPDRRAGARATDRTRPAAAADDRCHDAGRDRPGRPLPGRLLVRGRRSLPLRSLPSASDVERQQHSRRFLRRYLRAVALPTGGTRAARGARRRCDPSRAQRAAAHQAGNARGLAGAAGGRHLDALGRELRRVIADRADPRCHADGRLPRRHGDRFERRDNGLTGVFRHAAADRSRRRPWGVAEVLAARRGVWFGAGTEPAAGSGMGCARSPGLVRLYWTAGGVEGITARRVGDVDERNGGLGGDRRQPLLGDDLRAAHDANTPAELVECLNRADPVPPRAERSRRQLWLPDQPAQPDRRVGLGARRRTARGGRDCGRRSGCAHRADRRPGHRLRVPGLLCRRFIHLHRLRLAGTTLPAVRRGAAARGG